MRKLILFILISSSISCIGQDVKHTIGLIPASVCYNKGFFYSQGINYHVQFNKNFIFAGTEGTIFNYLDGNRRNNDNNKLIPLLNESRLLYGREIVNKEKFRHVNQLKAQVGYHYFQHGTDQFFDYWHIDSIPNNGVKGISGFQTHSASLGVHWSTTRYKKDDLDKENPKARFAFEFNYLLGLGIHLKGFNEYPAYQESTPIKNTYDMHRNGMRFSFQNTFFLSNRINLFTQYDLIIPPYIKYEANRKMYLLRGGESIWPFFPSLKLGLQFCL